MGINRRDNINQYQALFMLVFRRHSGIDPEFGDARYYSKGG